jgi:hypothetical protein
MEAGSGGNFNMEAGFRVNFQYGGRFARHKGRSFGDVKAKSFKLCLCSSARGKPT